MRPQWWVGKNCQTGFRYAFLSHDLEGGASFYLLTWGPFRTKRAAEWFVRNPDARFYTIAEVERMASEDAKGAQYAA